jgi:hypothetical protein
LTDGTVRLELIVWRFRITIALMLFGAGPAVARDNGQWVNSPKHIRQWFQSLMQPDNPAQSCCGEGDAFEADNWEIEEDGTIVAIITDGKGTVPNGTRIVVPDRKMKWDAGNPTGHGIIFLTSTYQAICYVTPGGV